MKRRLPTVAATLAWAVRYLALPVTFVLAVAAALQRLPAAERAPAGWYLAVPLAGAALVALAAWRVTRARLNLLALVGLLGGAIGLNLTMIPYRAVTLARPQVMDLRDPLVTFQRELPDRPVALHDAVFHRYAHRTLRGHPALVNDEVRRIYQFSRFTLTVQTDEAVPVQLSAEQFARLARAAEPPVETLLFDETVFVLYDGDAADTLIVSAYDMFVLFLPTDLYARIR